MIDSIQTFGDSFLFGSDLQDSNKNQYSLSTWPALVAKKLKLDYKCYGIGGIGNRFIADSVISESHKTSLVIINWTWIDRFDYYTSTAYKLRQANTIRPTNLDLISKSFYRGMHSEEDDKFRSLSYIFATHSYLKNNNIPFISTYMDRLLLNQTCNTSSGIIKLQDQLKKDLQTFPNGQTFLEWSRANGYPESEAWHPLEEAHEAAARYWRPIYEKEISKHIKIK